MNAKITYWLLLCLLPLYGLQAQGDLEYPIELCVTPGSSVATIKYNVLPGSSVTVYWGDGSSETLPDPKSRYAKAVSHRYDAPVTEGTKITLDGSAVTILEEPWAMEGEFNVSGFGKVVAPVLERFDFAFACPMSGSTTPYQLDLSRCPALKVVKAQNLRSITLPQEGRIEELSLATRLGTPGMPSLQGTLDLSTQHNLRKLQLTAQMQLLAIDLTGLDKLESLMVYNNPHLRRLIGVKKLTALKKANLSGNVLTYDQLPLFTNKLREDDVNYDQCPVVSLDPAHVSPRTVDLSFQHSVQDAEGRSYTTSYPNVMIAVDPEEPAPNMPIFSNQYSMEDGVFTLSESLFTQGGKLLDTLRVGIETHNDYYPHYALASETNQIVAKVPRIAGEQPTGQVRVTLSMTEGGTLSVAVINPWRELQSGDLVDRGTRVYIQSELEDGYQVDYYEINGEHCYEANQLLIEYTIMDDVEIIAHYKKIPAEGYTVTYGSEGGGSIESAYYMNRGKAVQIKSGDRIPAEAEITFVAKADKGHEIDYWRVDGETAPDKGNYLYYDLYRDAEVIAVFKSLTVPQHPFNFTYGPGGYLSVRLSSTQEIIRSGTLVKEGETVYCVPVPDPTFMVDKWILNGEERADWRDQEEVGILVDKPMTLEVTFRKGNALIAPTTTTVSVYISGDRLIAEGYAADELMSLYTAEGLLVDTISCCEPYDCSRLSRGLYLVQIGEQLYRIIIN